MCGLLSPAPACPPPCVVGLGDPVMDVLVHVSHEFLGAVSTEPGGCFQIDAQLMKAQLERAGEQGELVRWVGGWDGARWGGPPSARLNSRPPHPPIHPYLRCICL